MVSNRHSTITVLLRWVMSGYHQLVLVFRYLAFEHPLNSLEDDPYLVKFKWCEKLVYAHYAFVDARSWLPVLSMVS